MNFIQQQNMIGRIGNSMIEPKDSQPQYEPQTCCDCEEPGKLVMCEICDTRVCASCRVDNWKDTGWNVCKVCVDTGIADSVLAIDIAFEKEDKVLCSEKVLSAIMRDLAALEEMREMPLVIVGQGDYERYVTPTRQAQKTNISPLASLSGLFKKMFCRAWRWMTR